MNQSAPKPITHYDLPSLAKSLKLASIDVIKTTSVDVESHWYRSHGPADLYYWKAKDKIVKHQVSLYSQVVEWNEYDGVKTGYVNDDIDGGKAEIICFDQKVNTSVVRQVIEFLSMIDELEPQVVSELIEHYQFFNQWQGFGLFSLFRRMLGFLRR